ncbi:MAG: glycosyltransferase family 2 protein [Bacteroidales bacterium]|jgi:glycosyltransferase involved in cell wall biosynthesis|nr:glycosyltransferase family 2 protein [Bacteroidales bacterium]
MMMMKKISIVTPCYNEEANVEILYNEVKKQFAALPQYKYEHIFIDNASTDTTVSILKRLAAEDKNVKIIVNARNFGHIRSPFYGMRQAFGDAVILMVADLQDPPELIAELLKKWEEGFKIVTAVKNKSKENPIMFFLRKTYYNMLAKFSETEQVKNFTGFGLYDKSFIDVIRSIDDPYPYFRGLIAEIGFERTEITYIQPKRLHGKTKLNFYILYDIGMLGFVNHSKLPLRLSIFIGFIVAFLSLLVAAGYLIYKLCYWDTFTAGTAPLVIGLFFFSSIQLIFIGVIGEYIGAIHTQVRKRPLVVEKERINFDNEEAAEPEKDAL